jgi:hypothetical protein
LSRFLPALNGFANADLRETMQTLLNVTPDQYTAGPMSYDLRRLRLKGLIVRIEGSHRYVLTTYGRRVAYLMTKLQNRIFNVASVAVQTAALPSRLARAFQQLDAELEQLVAAAHLGPA